MDSAEPFDINGAASAAYFDQLHAKFHAERNPSEPAITTKIPSALLAAQGSREVKEIKLVQITSATLLASALSILLLIVEERPGSSPGNCPEGADPPDAGRPFAEVRPVKLPEAIPGVQGLPAGIETPPEVCRTPNSTT
ncbi:hypothetical protein NIM87_02295 [Devosia sp. XJ19-1]|uniref:Uncharacterized protein n=1 Tax=Devosia ureilytica TaxID=2952754 RepID=A0A9Q4FR22_9HYPH|nr:hypothetical protein [Devosia ureilytica]MCP8882326.1 hypothetical protein [Devosia ureilytica]MCP8885788.1 hypothetical protein [Devosia ureilytica]